MIAQSYTYDKRITYSANNPVSVALPKSGYITQIDMMLRVQVDTAGTVSAAEDGLARLIKGVTVSAAGSQVFMDLTDGRQLYWLDYLKLEGQLSADSLTTTPSQSDVDHYVNFILHWGFDWLNPYDKTVPIPTPELDNPTIRILWGSDSDLGTGYTIDPNNTYIELTIHELALEPGETAAEKWPNGLIIPRIEARTKPIDEVASNLGFEHSVPTGDVLYETLIMVLDSSGDRSDSEVTNVGVKFPKQRRRPWTRTWKQLKMNTRSKYRIPTDVTGVTLFSWEEVTRRAVGIDMRMAQVGDVQLAFDTAQTGGSIHFVHFMYG